MAEARPHPNPDGTVHARAADDYQRLRTQAAMWQETAETLFREAGA